MTAEAIGKSLVGQQNLLVFVDDHDPFGQRIEGGVDAFRD